jgi:pilus assembly protein CpaF
MAMKSGFAETVRSFLAPVIGFIDDDDVSEIMINSHDEIWIEKKGRIFQTDAVFNTEDELMSAVNNISQFVKRRISEEKPHMDARLPDGSRIHAILPPCARKGVCMAIRKFSKERLTIRKLLDFGSINKAAVKFLNGCVHGKANLLVSGGTGSGKTSLLNVVSGFIPSHERIIVIEDSAELQLQQDHVLLLETKVADNRGRGQVSIRDLLKSTLRLRPDRIIIGEIRSGEAIDLLQAMNTGHGGSMGTIHANAPLETLLRLETLTLFSGINLPLKAIRAQISSAINIIVQTSRFHDGSRKVTHISEVHPLQEDGNYKINDIFRYQQKGMDQEGKIYGDLEPTGTIPEFLEHIKFSGYELPLGIFKQVKAHPYQEDQK